MLAYLLPIFVIVPLLELWLLVRVGTAIGAGNTILLVLLTGVVGAALARREGLRTFARIQESLARGIMPTKELMEGLLIFIAGLVLVTPGVITDAIGFALLVPPIRARVGRRLARFFQSRVTVIGPGMGFGAAVQDEFIDVEHQDVTDDSSSIDSSSTDNGA